MVAATALKIYTTYGQLSLSTIELAARLQELLHVDELSAEAVALALESMYCAHVLFLRPPHHARRLLFTEA